jgi:hypothetical protein
VIRFAVHLDGDYIREVFGGYISAGKDVCLRSSDNILIKPDLPALDYKKKSSSEAQKVITNR